MLRNRVSSSTLKSPAHLPDLGSLWKRYRDRAALLLISVFPLFTGRRQVMVIRGAARSAARTRAARAW